MDDAEQQPNNQGESADKTADDDVECEDSYCAGYAVTEGDEPETHPADAEWEADTEPHQEVVTYAPSIPANRPCGCRPDTSPQPFRSGWVSTCP